MTIFTSDDSEDEESSGPIDYHEPNELTAEGVDPTFREEYEFPGTVKITVGDTTFWFVAWKVWPRWGPDCAVCCNIILGSIKKCSTSLPHSSRLHLVEGMFDLPICKHCEQLKCTSRWLETTRPASVASSIITIHQPPIVLRDGGYAESGSESTEIQHTATELSTFGFMGSSDIEDTDIFTLSEDDEEEESEGDKVKKEQDRLSSFEKLEGGAGAGVGSGASSLAGTLPPHRRSQSQSQGRSPGISTNRTRRTTRMRVPDAYIELKEEKVILILFSASERARC